MGLPEAAPDRSIKYAVCGGVAIQFTANRTLSVGTPLLDEPIVTAAPIMSASPQYG